MRNELMFSYCAVASVLFIIGIVIGKMLRKDVLNGGVHLGFFNSFYLSVCWPITMLIILIGWGYDAIKEWRRL